MSRTLLILLTFALTTASLALTACGNKGPLTLPADQAGDRVSRDA